MRMKTDRTSNSTGWLTKVSRLLIFTMMLCVFTGLGWYQPNAAHAETTGTALNTAITPTLPSKYATAAYVIMQRFQVTSVTGGTNDGLVTLSSLTLNNIGTAAVAAARVYLSTTSTTTLPLNAIQIGRTSGILSAATLTTVTLSSGTSTQRSVSTGTPAYVYVLYDMLSTQTSLTARSRVTAVNVLGPDTGATGLTYDSNGIFLLAGGAKATITLCTECHSNPPLDGPRSAATGSFLGSHNKHAGSLNYACTICHADNTSTGHRTGNIGLLAAFTTYSGSYSKGAVSGALKSFPQTTNPVMGSCSATYCHTRGTSNTPPFTGAASNLTPTWADPPAAECTGCHSGGSQTTTQMSTGSHTKHLVNCSLCHNATVSGTTTVSNIANHVNRKVDVRFTAAVAETTAQWRTLSAQTSTVSTTPGTSYATSSCSNIKCHSNGISIWNALPVSGTTPTWGAVLGCTNALGCHGNATYLSDYRNMVSLYASTTAQVSGAKPNAHDPHITNGTVNAGETQCKHCHYSTTTTNTTIAAGGTHGNAAYTVGSFGTVTYPGGENVSAAPVVSMTYTFNAFAGVSACSNVSCHPNGVGGVKPSMPWNDKSATAYACTNCHNINMTLAGGYHHSMGTTSYTPNPAAETDYPTTVPSGTWNTGTNPGSRTCLMCHVKHNIFSDRMNTNASLTQPRAMNLRTSISQAPTQAANYTNTDFIGSGTYGICVSCHVNSLAKDQVRQKPEAGATSTPSISGAVYSGSSHSYNVALITKTGARTFNANCVKCHDAQNGETASFYTGTSLGTHDSTVITATPIRRLLSALGITAAPASDSLEEKFCYRCHSTNTDLGSPGGGPAKPTANRDYYGGQAMSASSQLIYRDISAAKGTASGGSTTTLVDASRGVTTTAWAVNQWTGYSVKIVSGAGAGQSRRIISNNATTLTIVATPTWTAPNATSVYEIGGMHDMTLASGLHKPIEGTAVNWLPAGSRHVECEDCHNPHAAMDGVSTTSGTASAGGAGTITGPAGTNWPIDMWKHYRIAITGGTGAGQERYIASNTSATITIVGNWSTTPNNTSVYKILSSAFAGGGSATSGTATTLVDTSQTFPASLVGYFVQTVSGTGAGQVRQITGAAANTLTVATWTAPAAGTGYYIYKPPMIAGVNRGITNVVNAGLETQKVGIGIPADTTNMRNTAYTAKPSAAGAQYELCLTCHSTWAYNAEPSGINVPSAYPSAVDNWGSTQVQTDIGKDFDPDNYAHHALFAPGKNQPLRMGNAQAAALGQSIAYNPNWPYTSTGGASTGGTAGGTVAATVSSATITGTGTTFPAGAGAGWWIWINANGTATGTPTNPTTTGIGGGGSGWWPVAGRTSTTSLTLAVPFRGPANVSGSSYYLTKGLKTNFVDGWGPESLTTCTDCHQTSNTAVNTARGPHGSANRWMLKNAEPQTWTALNGAVTAYPATPNNVMNFCLNCHSYFTYLDNTIGGGQVGSPTPDNSTSSRIDHDAFNSGCFGTGTAGGFYQIPCMNCHGGAGVVTNATTIVPGPGTIHGSNQGVGFQGTSPRGFRFMNGAGWTGHNTVYSGNQGCYTTNGSSLSSCSQHTGERTQTGLYSY